MSCRTPVHTDSVPVMSENFDRLVAVMARLRDPNDGCPWDVEQDFRSIAPCTIEEAYEVADAIERGDMGDLKSELGDLLLQIVFHARMAQEVGDFNIEQVVEGITEKMIRRHPHVFGDKMIRDADAQIAAWEDQKSEERAARAQAENRRASVLDDVAIGLPALTRALKLQKRVARVGFDWANAQQVIDKLREGIAELEQELAAHAKPADRTCLSDEVGDLLFTCVNIARQLDIDPEAALRGGNAKFESRFRQLENDIAATGTVPQDLSLGALEAAWQVAKQKTG